MLKKQSTTINTQRFFPIFTNKKEVIICFFDNILWLTGISKNSRQLEEVFFSRLMHQLCRKHQKLTTTDFLLNRSSLTTFFSNHSFWTKIHFTFIFWRQKFFETNFLKQFFNDFFYNLFYNLVNFFFLQFLWNFYLVISQGILCIIFGLTQTPI